MISSSTGSQAVRTGGPSADRSAQRRVLVAMCFSLALVVSAVASLNVALPQLARDTQATQTEMQWIVDAYAVVFAGLLLFGGALGDRLGRRRMLAFGLVVFGLANLGAALTDDTGLITAGRAVSGVGAALIMPATLAIITTAFVREERVKAVGTWAGVAGAGAIVGLLLAGILVEIAGWEWVFAGHAIWALLALGLAMRAASESREHAPPPLDPVGAVLSAGGLAAVVFAVIEGADRGWGDTVVVTAFAGGALALVGFILWELRRDQPMLDPRVFLIGRFAGGSLSITMQFLAFFGFVFLLHQYLQLVLGYSAILAALALVPAGMAIGASARVAAPRLVRHRGPRAVNVLGLCLMAAGFFVLSTLDVDSTYWHLLAALALVGPGMGLATTPATTEIVAALPETKQGLASAVNDTSREVGGAVGIAILGSITIDTYRSSVEGPTSGLPPAMRDGAEESLGFALEAAGRLGPRGQELADAAMAGFVDGISTAFVVASVVLLIAAGLVAALGRRAGETEMPLSLAPAEAGAG